MNTADAIRAAHHNGYNRTNHRDPELVYHDLGWFGTADPRRIKRIERKALRLTPVDQAFAEGEVAAFLRGRNVNPYPAGLRATAWEQGLRGGLQIMGSRYA